MHDHNPPIDEEDTTKARSLLDFDLQDIKDMRPFNQHIVLPSARDEQLYETGSNADADFGEVNEEELSRDRVKKASTQILQVQQKKKKAREQQK